MCDHQQHLATHPSLSHTHTSHMHTHIQLLVISVLCYAIFETFYKKFGTKKDDPASAANGIRFVGFIGIHTLVWMWPPILILHYAGVEPFEWPEMQDFKLLVLNAALDVVFNGALLVSIALSSPLFVT